MSRTVLLLVAAAIVGAARADAQELELQVRRRSLHVGESVECTIHLRDREAIKNLLPDFNLGWGTLGRFAYEPKNTGEQNLGPIELQVGGKTLRSDQVRMHVLPPLPNEDFFEIRVYDTRISKRRREFVEVVIQSQVRRGIPSQFAQLEPRLPFPNHVVKEHADWKIQAWSQTRPPSFERTDAGHYMFDQLIEVVRLYPKRLGQLVIDKTLFIKVPKNYAVAPHVVEVVD